MNSMFAGTNSPSALHPVHETALIWSSSFCVRSKRFPSAGAVVEMLAAPPVLVATVELVAPPVARLLLPPVAIAPLLLSSPTFAPQPTPTSDKSAIDEQYLNILPYIPAAAAHVHDRASILANGVASLWTQLNRHVGRIVGIEIPAVAFRTAGVASLTYQHHVAEDL